MMFARPFFVSCLLQCVTPAAIVIPQQGPVSLEPSLRFRLLDEEKQAVLEYAENPQVAVPHSQSVSLFEASGAPLSVSSAMVCRADAGAVLSFFSDDAGKVPAFTLSFGLTIYDPVAVPSVNRNGVYGNVHVLVEGAAPGPVQKIRRITLSYPGPPFLVL